MLSFLRHSQNERDYCSHLRILEIKYGHICLVYGFLICCWGLLGWGAQLLGVCKVHQGVFGSFILTRSRLLHGFQLTLGIACIGDGS